MQHDPVPDQVTTNQLLVGLHARLDKQDSDLAEIKRFFNGDSAKGEDGAVSRLNAHSNDIGDMKDELTWIRRGVIAALVGVVITIAGWGLSQVAERAVSADTHK